MIKVAATLLALLLYASVHAKDEVLAAVLDGRWTYNAARSVQVDPDLEITSTATGSVLLNGRTAAWTPLAAGSWQVETSVVTLHDDTLTRAIHSKLPDGSPFERTTTYRRTGHGRDLVGHWRSIKVDTGSTWDGFIISTAPDGVVTWRIPTDLQVITGPFDGSDLPVVGPHGPTGETMAVSVAGPGRFTYIKKSAGQISDRGTITLSPDHHWMTEVTWEASQPQRKSRLVYERDSG
jgi:hypothetical protein